MIDAGGKVLLLGGSGLVGSAIARIFVEAGYRIDAPSHQEFDLNDLDKIVPGVEARSPELIINCAAMLGHENCETHPEAALHLNALAPKQLAIAAEKLAIPMVQISTSAVFDGRKPTPYVESDQPAPVNMYGGSKYLGECFVRANCSRSYIVRLPMVFGSGGKGGSFIERMVEKIRRGDQLWGTTDEFNTPLNNLAAALRVAEILRTSLPGCYHLSGGGLISLHGLLNFLASALRQSQVQPVTHDHFPRNCTIPLNGGLASINCSWDYSWQQDMQDWLYQTIPTRKTESF